MAKLDPNYKLIRRIAELKEQLAIAQETRRWRKTEDITGEEMDYDKIVEALEDCAVIPKFVTMAEIFLDEGSGYTHWRPIDLPEREDKPCGT